MLKKEGFTLIELLIVIAIIGILAVIVLGSVLKPKDRAMVNSMKTTVQSVRTAMELCAGTGGSIINGARSVGEVVCSGEIYTYPIVSDKCQNLNYVVSVGSGDANWLVTTTGTCGGCRLLCDVDSCSAAAEDSPGDCNM